MRNLKLLLGLTGLLTTLAITTATATAFFEANGTNTSQGPYQLSGSATFTTGTAPVTCEELTKGQWHIQTKAEKKEVVGGVTKIEQAPTKRGPHQAITGQFTKCTALVGGVLKVPATVNSECTLQLKQPTAGNNTTLGGVIQRCIITVPAVGCEITIFAGAPNDELATVTQANITAGVEAKSNVKGITSTVNKPCEENGITGNKTGEFVATGIAHSEKLV